MAKQKTTQQPALSPIEKLPPELLWDMTSFLSPFDRNQFYNASHFLNQNRFPIRDELLLLGLNKIVLAQAEQAVKSNGKKMMIDYKQLAKNLIALGPEIVLNIKDAWVILCLGGNEKTIKYAKETYSLTLNSTDATGRKISTYALLCNQLTTLSILKGASPIDNLSGYDLSKSIFAHGKSLNGYKLDRVAFLSLWNNGRSDFAGADLSKIDLSKLDLSNINLHGANLEGAVLSNTILKRVNLFQANFHQTDCTNVDFSDATIRDVDFSESLLIKANFSGNEISNTTFNYADADGANFTKAVFEGYRKHKGFFDTTITETFNNFYQTNFTGASFKSADLKNNGFRESDFSNTDLSETNINYATFRQTIFDNTRLVGTKGYSNAFFNETSLQDFNRLVPHVESTARATLLNLLLDYLGGEKPSKGWSLFHKPGHKPAVEKAMHYAKQHGEATAQDILNVLGEALNGDKPVKAGGYLDTILSFMQTHYALQIPVTATATASLSTPKMAK